MTWSRCYLGSAPAKKEREHQPSYKAADVGHVSYAASFSRLRD